MYQLQADSSICGLAFSNDGHLASSDAEGNILVWNLTTRNVERRFVGSHSSLPQHQLAFTADNQHLIAVLPGPIVRRFSVRRGIGLSQSQHQQPIFLTSDGRYLCEFFLGGVDCREVVVMPKPGVGPNPTFVTEPDMLLWTASFQGPGRQSSPCCDYAVDRGELAIWHPQESTIQFLDIHTGRASQPAYTADALGDASWHSDFANLIISPNGRWLITIPEPRILCLEAAHRGSRPLAEAIEVRYPRNFLFTSDSRQLLVTTFKGVIHRCDTETWTPRPSWKWPDMDITALAVSPDGLLAAVGDEAGTITVWDLDE